jgi:hypothetical protein
MTDNFKTITDAFAKAGVNVTEVEFSITEYSLNSSLSFKFNNSDDLFLFLEVAPGSEKGAAIKAMFVDAGIDPDKFFYVNFYKPKVAEL